MRVKPAVSSMAKRPLVFTVLLLTVIGAAVAASRISSVGNGPLSSGASRELGPTLTDLSDPARLVGFADNVFVGRVAARTGQQGWGESERVLREVQYQVQVLETLKGNLSGEVVVSVIATEGDTDVLVEEAPGDPLGVGQEYLFSTRTHPSGVWQTVAIPHSRIPIQSPDHLGQLRQLFLEAVKRQIPYPVPSRG